MKFIGIVLGFLGVFFLFSWAMMILWGALGNEFGFFTISYWQAALVSFVIFLTRSYINFKLPKKG